VVGSGTFQRSYRLTNFTTDAMSDADGDGALTWQEWWSDTDPTNKESVLSIIGITSAVSGLRLDWKGGEWATQYLDVRRWLDTTGEVWSSVYTNAVLPTPITNFVIDTGATNPAIFYRIRAVR
jgi:hypothetical protein